MSNAKETVESSSTVRSNRKERTGTVVSDCQDKTIIVEIVRRAPHKLYKKVVKKKKRYTAHDENNEAKVGNTVKIIETRPISKNKNWRLHSIIRHSE